MREPEYDRQQIFEALEAQHGTEVARKIMAYLPHVPWTELATKADLAALQAHMDARFERVDARFERVDARFDSLEAHFNSRFESLESRFESLESRFESLAYQFDSLGTRVDSVGDRVLAATRGELIEAITGQTRTVVFTMAGTVLAFGALLVAVLQLS